MSTLLAQTRGSDVSVWTAADLARVFASCRATREDQALAIALLQNPCVGHFFLPRTAHSALTCALHCHATGICLLFSTRACLTSSVVMVRAS